MSTRVLVAYGTKHGATAGIAEKIGEVLVQAGLSAEVLPVNQVEDINTYSAVVLGSAVYIGRWRKEAAKFLKANENTLAERPVWLFSSGPTGSGDPVKLTEGWRFPKALQPIADHIRPRDVALFHGAMSNDNLSSFEKWIIKKVKASVDDFRDWNAITSWAKAVAEELKKTG
jgi:menaquinone-dependent protoporphyrinogen oxidase